MYMDLKDLIRDMRVDLINFTYYSELLWLPWPEGLETWHALCLKTTGTFIDWDPSGTDLFQITWHLAWTWTDLRQDLHLLLMTDLDFSQISWEATWHLTDLPWRTWELTWTCHDIIPKPCKKKSYKLEITETWTCHDWLQTWTHLKKTSKQLCLD